MASVVFRPSLLCCRTFISLVFKKSKEAVSTLREKYDPLFKCLQIIVKDLDRWSAEDVIENLQGGSIIRDANPADFQGILDALRAQRVFKVNTLSSKGTSNTVLPTLM